MALPRARFEVDLHKEEAQMGHQRQAALRAMPISRLRRLQSYQALLGVVKPSSRVQPAHTASKLRGLQAELESRRRELMQQVDLDQLVAGAPFA